MLNILSWIATGLIVGFVASKVVNLRGDDPRFDIGIGACAALVVGILYSMVSGNSMTMWSPWSLLFAAIGAVVALTIWHIVRARYATHERQSVRRSY